MNINKKRSYIHKANRSRSEESDMPLKMRIQQYFNKLGVYFLTDKKLEIIKPYHLSDREKKMLDNLGVITTSYRLPDLYEKNNELIIELDGPVHGNGEIVTKKTVDKMEDYLANGYFPCNVPLEWCEFKGITPEQFIEVYIQLHKTWELRHGSD